MNERLYFHSDELEAISSVLQCSAGDDGLYRVMLSRTLFHPQGGGQPSDSGTIGDARVLRVLNDGDSIVHLTDRAIAPGEVSIKVDADSRSLHTRLHSAGHLIGFLGEQMGWSAVKGHHWPGEARVVFEGYDDAAIPAASQLEQAVNALLQADLVRHTAMDTRGRTIGFGHLPAHPCGGTHVSSLAQIGRVHIDKIRQKKGQLSVCYSLGL